MSADVPSLILLCLQYKKNSNRRQDMQRMATAKEVADYMKIPVQMVYRKTKRGELPHYRSGRVIRYKLSEIDEALKVREVKA